jgi:hypothetical protein
VIAYHRGVPRNESTSRLLALVLGAAAVGFLACSGGSSSSTNGAGGSGGTGVDGSKRLDTLTSAEKGALCDAQAADRGGYGHAIECDGGGLKLDAPDSQAACIANWFTDCANTVSDWQACLRDTTCNETFPATCNFLNHCK